MLKDAAAATAAAEAAAKDGQRKRAEESKGKPGDVVGTVEPPSFICDCHSSCAPPQRVKAAIELSCRRLTEELSQFEWRAAQLMEKLEVRKKEVEGLLLDMDAPPITPASASEYQCRLWPPPKKARAVTIIDSDDDREAEREVKEVRRRGAYEYDEEMEESAEPFYFIHVGWLQRWLTGQTEREWSDAQAEKIGKSEVKHTDASSSAGRGDRHDRSDAIVLDEDNNDEGGTNRITPSPSEQQHIVVTDDEKVDDEELQITSHRQSSSSSPLLSSSTSPPPWSSASPSPSASLLDDNDPMYPGDLFESVHRLQCEHGRLDPHPHNLLRTKRISVKAWNALKKQNAESQRIRSSFLATAGYPPTPPRPEVDLDEGSLCSDCVVRIKAAERELLSQREEFDTLMERMKEFTSPAGKSATAFKEGEWSQEGLLLDRDWYRELVERVKRHKQKAYSAVPLQAGGEEDINAGLYCEHGRLVLNKEEKAYLISPAMWNSTLIRLWPNSTAFLVTDEECERCAEEGERQMEERESLRLLLLEEQGHAGLRRFVGTGHHDAFPDPKRALRSGRHYILPTRWVLHDFLPYQEQVIINTSLPVRPRPSPVAISSLLCPHRLLRLHPVPKALTARKPELLPGVDAGEVTVCEENVWVALQKLGYAGKAAEEGELTEVSVDVSSVEVDEDVCVDNQWEQLHLRFSPALCDTCIRERDDEEYARLHYFSNGSLHVKRVSKTLPMGAHPSASGQTSMDTYLGPSSRSRRKRTIHAMEEFTVFHVDASEDVMTLKMKVTQYCSYSPAQLRLYWNEEELKDGRKLSDHKVTDGGELLMKVDVDGGDRDFLDYLPTDDAVFPHNYDVESGFAGTRLTTAGGGAGGGGLGDTDAKKPQTGLSLLPRPPAALLAEGSKVAPLSAPVSNAPLLPRLVDASSASSSSSSPSPPRSVSSSSAAVASAVFVSSVRSPARPSASPTFLHELVRDVREQDRLREEEEESSLRLAKQLQEMDREAAAQRQRAEANEAASLNLVHRLEGERMADRYAGVEADEQEDDVGQEEGEGEDEHHSDDDWDGEDDHKAAPRRRQPAAARPSRNKNARARPTKAKQAKGAAKRGTAGGSQRGSGSAKGRGGGGDSRFSPPAPRRVGRGRRSVEEEGSGEWREGDDDGDDDQHDSQEEEKEEEVGDDTARDEKAKSSTSRAAAGYNWLTGGANADASGRPPPPPSSPSQRHKAQPRAVFSCSACTYINPEGSERCEVCATPRPSSTLRQQPHNTRSHC